MTSTPSHIGPYRILDVLGRGGMGVVYLAQHATHGHRVALKTVRVRDRTILASIRREIRAITALSHPGIVQVHEHGLHEGLPWYAMERLEGVTLRALLDASSERTGAHDDPVSQETEAIGDAGFQTLLERPSDDTAGALPGNLVASLPSSGATPTRPSPADRASRLAVLIPLCHALAYMHGEGLVHGDLKPDNVVIEEDGRVVLVDFGLVRAERGGVGRETLAAPSAGKGSLRYMAPEQIAGGHLDARSDLYALGCILYEAWCGQVPFDATSASEILRKHLRESPRPPSLLVPDTPAELEAVLLRLLQKQPSKRPGYAEDLARFLATCTAQPPPVPGITPRTHLYRPACVGRRQELSTLRGAITSLTRERTGGVLLIQGPSGVGKTRLASELLLNATAGDRCDVLTADARPHAAFASLRAPLAAIADRCASLSAETRVALAPELQAIATFEPRYLGLPEVQRRPPLPELPEREQLLREDVALLRVLESLARERPLVLAIDDLQWADPRTRGWLAFAARSGFARRVPLLIVATQRGDDPSVLPAHAAKRLHVGPLDAEAVARMIASMLAIERCPPELARRLHRHTGGSPFFIAELLRSAVDRGALTRDHDGRWRLPDEDTLARHLGDLPVTLEALLALRLRHLPDDARALAQRAAVLGRRLDPELLLPDAAHEVALDALITGHILHFTPSGHLAFTHDTLQRHAYDALEPAHAQALHRDIADRLLRLPDDDALTAAAWHWERAGDLERAREAYLKATERAEARSDLISASLHLQQALRLPQPPTPELCEHHIRVAELLFHQGLPEDATHHAERAERIAQQLDASRQQALALLWRGRLEAIRGDVDAGLEHIRHAGRVFDALDDDEGLARQRMALLVLLLDTGRHEPCEAIAREALDLYRQIGDRRGEGLALGKLAGVHYLRGELDPAQDCLRASIDIHRETGHRHAEGVDLSNLANGYLDRGQHELGRALYEEALEIHREVGNRRFEGITLANLAASYSDTLEFERAEPLFHQALRINREVGNRLFEGIALANLGKAVLDQGRFHEARHHLREAIDIHRELSNTIFEGYAQLSLAIIHRRLGELEEAEQRLSRAAVPITASQNPYLSGLLEVQRGHLALALPDGDPHPHLARAQLHAHTIGTSEDSELGRAVRLLHAALGTPHRVHGEAIHTLSPRLRAALGVDT